MSETDHLFQLPLGEFTAARNALAVQLKKSGRSDDARRVRELPKPSVPAWVVNQLFWRHRPIFDRLITSGERLRRAQAAQLAGTSADLREPIDARRTALSELARLAAATLVGASHNPTPEILRRITTSLEALSIYGRTEHAPSAGRLTDEVNPPGFETLASLVPSVGTPARAAGPSTVVPFRRKSEKAPVSKAGGAQKGPARLEEEREERRAAAQVAVQQGERDLREAQQAAERAEATLRRAAAHVNTAEQAKATAERRLEESAAALAEARTAARQVAGDAEAAAEAVADAERALAKARERGA